MTRRALALAALLLAGCHRPEGDAAGAAADANAADVSATDGVFNTDVPDDAPATPALRNVPATTGRANLPAAQPPFAITTIGRFDNPFAMAFLPDGRLLVTEKPGHLQLRATDGSVREVAFAPAVADILQGGLLDVALAPDFATSHALYLSYSEPGADHGAQLALMRATLRDAGQQLGLFDKTVIWRSGSSGPGGQFGARIVIAPDGKSLFLTSGERQRFTPAQDAHQAIGKILHLTLDGKPAPGNPDGGADRVAAMTWSSGHRNPYGLVFTPDGRLWETEMGPKGGDELNLIEPGKNYGWPIVSNGDNYSGKPIADHPSRPDLAAPILWWNPSISPSGLIYYSGAMFPRYQGNLFVPSLSGQVLVRIVLDGGKARAVDQWDMGIRVRAVAQAPDGAIWLLEDGPRQSAGRLMRLTPKG